MNLKIILIASCLVVSAASFSQTDTKINSTDQKGLKQGHWIRKYPNQAIIYEGYFTDDHPVGEFKRYNEDNSLKSVLIYSADGREADATIYHSNGNIASKGKYINQLKEGKWLFFSEIFKGYLVSEELYTGNIRNGVSLKFYPDSTIAEKLYYIKGVKQGEWIQYFSNGSVCLKSNWLDGKVNGKYEVWYENGAMQFSGQYKNDVRDGIWQVFNIDGSPKYKIGYLNGITTDQQMAIDESDFLDSLERNKGKIADPEKTGILR